MNHRAEINTELLYCEPERAKAHETYAADHPAGPEWEQADQKTRGRYLEAAGRTWLAQLKD